MKGAEKGTGWKKCLYFAAGMMATVALGLLVYLVVMVQTIDYRTSQAARPYKIFTTALIQNTFRHDPEWDVKMPAEMLNFVNMLTQQPFYWLGKGFQAVAFGSEDGEYVFKFFLQTRLQERSLKSHPFQYLLSKDFRDKGDMRKMHRREIFSSSKMAYEEFPEESGIVFVHLNRTHNKVKGIKLIDAFGQPHRIRGDDTSFIVQKRAVYVLPTLKALMNEGKVMEAQARIDQIFDLVFGMAKKGFLDSDEALVRNNNIGFVKDRAIYIDTGHIAKESNVNLNDRMEYEFGVRLSPLRDWLAVAYPDLAAYYDKRKDEIMDSIPVTVPIPLESAA